ncbi:hypothetical protein GN956_G20265 [Arapaima gigas]
MFPKNVGIMDSGGLSLSFGKQCLQKISLTEQTLQVPVYSTQMKKNVHCNEYIFPNLWSSDFYAGENL